MGKWKLKTLVTNEKYTEIRVKKVDFTDAYEILE